MTQDEFESSMDYLIQKYSSELNKALQVPSHIVGHVTSFNPKQIAKELIEKYGIVNYELYGLGIDTLCVVRNGEIKEAAKCVSIDRSLRKIISDTIGFAATPKMVYDVEEMIAIEAPEHVQT